MAELPDLKKVIAIIIIVISISIFPLLYYEPKEYTEYSSTRNIDNINYEKIVDNAGKAGYDVINENKESGNYLFNIIELNTKLGSDFGISRILYRYDEKSYIVIDPYLNKNEVIVKFYNDSIFESLSSFGLKNLPPDDWVAEKFKLMFNLDDDEALDYLNKLKDSSNNTRNIFLLITIDRHLDFMDVYFDIKGRGNNITFSNPEEGLVKQSFYYRDENQDKEIGGINYFISNTKIIFKNKEHTYSIHIDRSGSVALSVRLEMGKTIPDKEYRDVFKNMFAKIGISPDKINEFKFNYNDNDQPLKDGDFFR